MELAAIIILAVIVFVFISLMISAYCAYRYSSLVKVRKPSPYKHVREGDPLAENKRRLVDGILAVDFEDVYVTSHDGLKLHGRLHITSEDAPFAICAHGYHSSGFIDFSGGALYLIRKGYNVLLIDQRAHGESEGKCLTFGVKESRDVADWARFVIDKYSAPVFLFGISMGAVTVLLASALPELPDGVLGIVADCPFSSARDIIIRKTRSKGIRFPGFCYKMARLGARVYGGYDPAEADAVARAPLARVPVILMHGQSDDFVPYEMSQSIHDASGAPLHAFPTADHGTAYVHETERYERIVDEFCESCLSDKKGTEK